MASLISPEHLCLPPLFRVRQRFPLPREENPAAAVARELDRIGLKPRLRPGMRIALTAGSRGIANIAQILRTAADYVRAAGAEPVIVAAMGSHGGATVEGQLTVLRSYGIDEASVGAPILAGTETILVGRTEEGLEVYFDRIAARCDGVLVINRVKPHTTFTAPNESGLLKMVVVGLGKEKGATLFHSLGQAELPRLLPEMAAISLAAMPILGGIALVENGAEETAVVRGVHPAEFAAVDAELLRLAQSLMLRLPSDQIDLLLVDLMGKNFSGTGMDTKIIGRMRLDRVPEPERPAVRRIVVLGLSPESHGNANGLNLADVVTRRLVNSIDFGASYANCVATTFLQRVAIPVTMETERDAVAVAWRSLGSPAPETLRMVRIRNTLHLEEVWVSPAILQEMESERPEVYTVLDGPAPLRFDPDGNLQEVIRT